MPLPIFNHLPIETKKPIYTERKLFQESYKGSSKRKGLLGSQSGPNFIISKQGINSQKPNQNGTNMSSQNELLQYIQVNLEPKGESSSSDAIKFLFKNPKRTDKNLHKVNFDLKTEKTTPSLFYPKVPKIFIKENF